MQNDGGYGGVPFFLRYPLSSTHHPPSLSFHTVVHSLHSFAKERNSTLLLSWASALFHKKHRVWGEGAHNLSGLTQLARWPPPICELPPRTSCGRRCHREAPCSTRNEIRAPPFAAPPARRWQH